MPWPDIALLAAAFLGAYFVTPAAAAIARRIGLVDAPGGPLKRHLQLVPRAGGIALLIALGLAAVVSAYIESHFLSALEAVGALVVFMLGVWDDRSPRPAGVRLVLQIGAYAFLYFAGLRVETALPALVD